MTRAPLVAGMLLVFVSTWGCGSRNRTPRPQASPGDQSPPSQVKAQGTLQPLGGILNITALPGDEIESILVEEGDDLVPQQQRDEAAQGDDEAAQEKMKKKKTVLALLKSRAIRKIEMELATARVTEAKQRIAAEKLLAKSKLGAAKLSGSEASLQKKELEKRREEIALLKQQRDQAEAKLQNLNELRKDKLTKDVTSQQDVDGQQLLVNKLNADIEQGEKLLDAAEASHDNAKVAAAAQVAAAQHSADNVQALSPLASLKRAAVLAEMNFNMTEIKSPIAGKVLRVLARNNDRVTNMPLMQIADTTKMACIAEVYESNLQHVEPGDRVTLRSPALQHDLEGTVLSKGRIIGRPRLPNPNPLSRQDVRTGEVVIQLAPGDSTDLAAQYINLQVDVTIQTEAAEAESTPAKASDADPDRS